MQQSQGTQQRHSAKALSGAVATAALTLAAAGAGHTWSVADKDGAYGSITGCAGAPCGVPPPCRSRGRSP